jgi:hypothetical protein
MKKLLLTAVVAFSTLVASAQFMVVTTYDGDQEESMDKITTNMGIGYIVNDMITVGIANGGDDSATGEGTYDIFARYNIAQMEGAYASLTMPGDDAEDMSIGVGFAFNVWNGLYVEPNYTMPTSEDAEGNREGSFNFGLSYRF